MSNRLIVNFIKAVLLTVSCSIQAGTPIVKAPFERRTSQKIVTVKPEIRKEGIFFGDKGLIVHNKGYMTLISKGMKRGDFYTYFSSPYSKWISTNFKGLKNTSINRNTENALYTFKADFPLAPEKKEEMPVGKYEQTVRLTEDNKIEVTVFYSIPENTRNTLNGAALFFSMPFATAVGRKCLIDGKEFVLQDNERSGKMLFRGKPKSIIFAPGNPETEFSIELLSDTSVWLRMRRDKLNFRFILDRKEKEQKIKFLLNINKITEEMLQKSGDNFAGIDFWKADRLHVPDWGKSRNLIQNPSFESGLRYFSMGSPWGVYIPRSRPVFSVDDKIAKFGVSSLKINCIKDDHKSGFLDTFVIPTISDEKYTVSFFARGNRKSGLSIALKCITGEWLKFPELGEFKINEKWSRYSSTFTAPNRAAAILLKGGYNGDDPSKEGTIWVDGLQLEKGEKATAFVDQPVRAFLKTSDSDNFLFLTDNISAELIIKAKPDSEGKVLCELKNFFNESIWSGEFEFKTNGRGVAKLKLPLDGKTPAGLSVLRTDFKLRNGVKITDFFRLTRISPLHNTHKHKNIFGMNMPSRHFRGKDLLKRCRDIGIGSENYSDAREEYSKWIKEYGITATAYGVFRRYPPGVSAEHKREIAKLKKTVSLWEKLTPERIKLVEDFSYKSARKFPWQKAWFLEGECEAGGGQKFKLLANGDVKGLTDLFIACYKGVKRANPDNEVYLSGGPTNMAPTMGIRLIESYLDAIDGKVKFDAVAIHPYRATPENPDLDSDAQRLFDVLDKHGYQDVPVYWNEGGYYYPLNIPQWGLTPHKGCSSDHYRCGAPSYHMGWGEKIAAAYTARSWLVALKYGRRVKQLNVWGGRSIYMDAYLTPYAIPVMANTLGRLLGNADFKKDIRFAPEVRAYIFEDEKNRPVVAIWSCIPEVDRGLKMAPFAEFDFGKDIPEYFDLMCNKRGLDSENGKIKLRISSFPFFLRGKTNSLKELCDAISNARLIDSNMLTVAVSAKPVNLSEMEAIFRNLITKPFIGTAVIDLDGEKLEKQLNIPANSVCLEKLPLKDKIPYGRIRDIKMPVVIKEKGFKPVKTDLSFPAFAVHKALDPIKVDGNLEDWGNIPAIRLKNRNIIKTAGGNKGIPLNNDAKIGFPGDHEAEFKITWDDKHLYLLVKVNDDKFYVKPDEAIPGAWRYDCLQVYIDTQADARNRQTKGHDENDYNYNFYPAPKGNTVTVYRATTPNQQIAGGLLAPKPNRVEPEVKANFTIIKNGYFYEIAFPKRLVAPMPLKRGSIAGFSVYLADNDGREYPKSALTTTPPGTGGFRNPHLYPLMILTEK